MGRIAAQSQDGGSSLTWGDALSTRKRGRERASTGLRSGMSDAKVNDAPRERLGSYSVGPRRSRQRIRTTGIALPVHGIAQANAELAWIPGAPGPSRTVSFGTGASVLAADQRNGLDVASHTALAGERAKATIGIPGSASAHFTLKPQGFECNHFGSFSRVTDDDYGELVPCSMCRQLGELKHETHEKPSVLIKRPYLPDTVLKSKPSAHDRLAREEVSAMHKQEREREAQAKRDEIGPVERALAEWRKAQKSRLRVTVRPIGPKLGKGWRRVER